MLARVATCNLNQWAMDFRGNLERIKESIREAKAAGCTFRTGPELEITGYGCEDSFLELDTFEHAWESLHELLDGDLTDGILCDVGMPVQHRNVAYNCRVVCFDRKIVGLRPKVYLANDGNYREMRYFTPWYIEPGAPGFGPLQDLQLPENIRTITGQAKVPIGIFAISSADTVVSFETCEELFTPNAPNILFSLDGVEIIANGSGSHHVLRKLNTRIELCQSATKKSGGVYLCARPLKSPPRSTPRPAPAASRVVAIPRRHRLVMVDGVCELARRAATPTRRAAMAGDSTSTAAP